MALVIKRKATPATEAPTSMDAPTSQEELTERQKNALEDVGLLPLKPAPKAQALSVGDKVTVNHNLFPWVKSYGRGDTGVITAFYPNRDRVLPDHEQQDLFTVKLDTPRLESSPTVDLHRWELDLA